MQNLLLLLNLSLRFLAQLHILLRRKQIKARLQAFQLCLDNRSQH